MVPFVQMLLTKGASVFSTDENGKHYFLWNISIPHSMYVCVCECVFHLFGKLLPFGILRTIFSSLVV